MLKPRISVLQNQSKKGNFDITIVSMMAASTLHSADMATDSTSMWGFSFILNRIRTTIPRSLAEDNPCEVGMVDGYVVDGHLAPDYWLQFL
jgi:hypothetical protein